MAVLKFILFYFLSSGNFKAFFFFRQRKSVISVISVLKNLETRVNIFAESPFSLAFKTGGQTELKIHRKFVKLIFIFLLTIEFFFRKL